MDTALLARRVALGMLLLYAVEIIHSIHYTEEGEPDIREEVFNKRTGILTSQDPVKHGEQICR